MKAIIEISCKAKQVFKYIELLNRHKGNLTLKELAKDNKPIKLDLRPK